MIFNGFLKQIQIGQGIQSAKATSNVCSNGSCGLGSCHTQQNLPLVVEINNEPPVNQPRYENFIKLHRESHQSHEKRSSFQD